MNPSHPSEGPHARQGARLHLVVGTPAQRRQRLLELAAQAAEPFDAAWWIVDTPAAAAAVRRRLPTTDLPGRLGVGVMTLRQAAASVLLGTTRLPLGPAARQALIAELAAVAGHKEALGPLEPLIDSPGLIDFLGSRFRQLRRQGVGPQQAGSALRQTDGEEAGSVLARLYRDYLAAIDDGDFLDDEETIILAADLLDPAQAPRRLFLDLPLTITPIEQQFVQALASYAEEAFASVAGPDTGRGAELGLPAVQRLRERWQEIVGVESDTPHEPIDDASNDHGLPAGLRALRDRLFDDNAEKSGDATGVRVVAGSNAHDTARRVAQRVKRLLASGVQPTDVVLAAPTLDATAPRYAEALREYGVPATIDAAPRLGTAPAVGAALDLLEAASSDWSFDRLLALLSRSDLTAFSTRGPGEGLATVRAATEWLVRELQTPKGRAYLQRQVDQLSQREETSSAVRRLVVAAQAAGKALTRLGEACDLLPKEPTTPLAWLDATDTALRKLGHAGLVSSADAADRRAGDALEEAAASIETLSRWRGRDPRRIGLREWTGLVRAWASRLRLPSDGGAEGRVPLVGLTTAIGLPCKHLLVVDAGESAFTSPDAAGADEAMLLFYELAATPSQSLTFAYAALDDAAQPLSASPFVADVERLFTAGALRAGERSLLRPIDLESPPASQREWRLQAVGHAAAGVAGDLVAYGAQHGPSIVTALRAIDARARGESFGPWEGVLSGDAVHQLLGKHYDSKHLWSASQLELMATCPYKFFARQVLHMQPVGDLALDVDYRRRGQLMHDALAECLTELTRELAPGESLRSVPPGEFTERLVRLIEAQVASGKLPAHEAALARIEARQAAGWATRYADQQTRFDNDPRWRDFDVALRPALLEARFGPAKNDEGAEDSASVDQPLELPLPGGETLLVTGRIDRIDTGRLGERTLFAVIDYKTSKEYAVKVEHMESGRQLQPVLYALAAQRLLLGDDAIPVGAGYWVLQKNGFVAPKAKDLPLVVYEDGEARPADEWRAMVETVRQRCEQLVQQVRGGCFPMHNEDEDCGRSCEFRTVCRVAQARSLGKTPVSEKASGDKASGMEATP